MSRLFNIHFPFFFAVTFVTTATFMGFALYLTDHVWLFPVIPLVLLTTSGFGIIAGSLLGYFLGSIGFLLIILLCGERFFPAGLLKRF